MSMTTAEYEARIQDLEAFLEGDAICPCCQEVRECADGCTFSEDSPMDAERMNAVRNVLYGTVPAPILKGAE